MDFEDRIKVSQLFQEYGELLTKKQREALRLYCDMDLSLNEIAAQYGVSRQAVRDSIIHSVNILYEFENKLGLNELRQCISEVLNSDLTDSQKLERIRKIME